MAKGYTPEQQRMQDQKEENDFRFQTNQKLQNQQFAIDMINKSLAECIGKQGSDKVDLRNQLESATKECASILKEFKTVLDNFERTMKENANFISSSLEVSKKTYLPRMESDNQIFELKEQLKRQQKEHEDFKNQVNQIVMKNASDYEAKLKSFRDEIISKPSPIPDLTKMFEDKIELVALNGTNSILRSTNNEKQIALIEKKIEQVYLLIKQIELNRQAS